MDPPPIPVNALATINLNMISLVRPMSSTGTGQRRDSPRHVLRRRAQRREDQHEHDADI